MPTHTTQLTCVLRAPRERVYQALLDPQAVQQWMVPDGMTSEVHVYDAVVGGRLRVSLTYDLPAQTGKSTAHTDTYQGRFVALAPGRRVVQTMAFETADPAMRGEMRVTYELLDTPGGTELRVVHDQVPEGVAPEDNALGWRLALEKLQRLVEAEG